MMPASSTPIRTAVRFVISEHPDYSGEIVDFGELFCGAPDTKSGNALWRGGFSARPELAAELLPAVRAIYAMRTLMVLNQALTSLRSFFRFLDSYEVFTSTESTRVRVTRLHQISSALLEAFAQPGPHGKWHRAAYSYASNVRTIVFFAISTHGLPELTTGYSRRPKPALKDTATEREGLLIIRHLRSQVLAVIKRWQRADRLALSGRDLAAIYLKHGDKGCRACSPTEADAHATFRAYIKNTGTLIPDGPSMYAKFGGGRNFPIAWWPRNASGETVGLLALIAGLYPTSEDVATFALMCLARSAWNPSTLLNIELGNWYSTFDADNAWIYAVKDRAQGTLQYSISPRAQQSGVFNLVSLLIERSAPLRAILEAGTGKRTEIGKRSPWIGVNGRPSEQIYVADPREVRTLNNWLKRHVEQCNATLEADQKVRHVTASDFRDIAAASTFQRSNYSVFMMMILLGHRRISSARAYGFRRSSREESHRLVLQVVDNVLEQSRVAAKWDATLTRAAVESVDFDSADLQRLADYRANRTYSGAICKDPTNPPRSIDPNHPNDGKAVCIQGHLCVARSCPQAVVFNDSIDSICKTIAELECRRDSVGAVRFQASSSWDDLERLRTTAEQWPSQEVTLRISEWTRRISSGAHIPILFAGQH